MYVYIHKLTHTNAYACVLLTNIVDYNVGKSSTLLKIGKIYFAGIKNVLKLVAVNMKRTPICSLLHPLEFTHERISEDYRVNQTRNQ